MRHKFALSVMFIAAILVGTIERPSAVSISTPPPLAEMPHVHAHPHHADAETPSLCDVLTDPEARHRAGCP